MHRLSREKSIWVNHTQLPLVPAWAFADYRVQGALMDGRLPLVLISH